MTHAFGSLGIVDEFDGSLEGIKRHRLHEPVYLALSESGVVAKIQFAISQSFQCLQGGQICNFVVGEIQLFQPSKARQGLKVRYLIIVEYYYLQLPHACQWRQVIDLTIGELERNHLIQVILGEVSSFLSGFDSYLRLYLHVACIIGIEEI